MKKQKFQIAALFLMGIISVNALAANPDKTLPAITNNYADLADPHFKVKGERILVNFLNLEGNTVIVKVLDQENRVLYMERIKDATVIEKAINFEKAYEGIYRVEVSLSGEKENFSETLKIVR